MKKTTLARIRSDGEKLLRRRRSTEEEFPFRYFKSTFTGTTTEENLEGAVAGVVCYGKTHFFISQKTFFRPKSGSANRREGGGGGERIVRRTEGKSEEAGNAEEEGTGSGHKDEKECLTIYHL